MMFALFTTLALASGTATPKPPAPPAVDLSVLPASARVQPPSGDKPHPVVAHLVADRASVAPGGSVRVGVVLAQQEGWHTYWRSPGDIGQPTVITWQLPDGTEVVPYVYPVPQRFELEGIVSFGYEDRSVLYSTLALPADLAPGTTTIGAHVEWLVCQESCIPGRADLSLPLTVGADSGPNAFSGLLDHYQAQQPVASPAGLVASAVVEPATLVPDKPFTLTVTVAAADGHALGPVSTDALWPAFTPIIPAEVFVTAQTIEALPGGGYKAVVKGEVLAADPPPDTSVFGGLAQVTLDGRAVATEVVVDAPWEHGAVVPVADTPNPATTPVEGPAIVAVEAAPAGFLSSLSFAFLGGLLLNIMPCVLPVLTLKLYGLVEGGNHSALEQRKAGLAYTAGVLASFLALAGVVYGLRVGMGAQIGWGFQFQSPVYVALLGAVVFAFGLSLFGLFEIPVIGANTASDAASKEGHLGHFFAGVFATVLGTPCSAPFLAPAVGYAFSQPDFFTMALFFCTIGLGLAAPFLLVAFVPALFKIMPQPGAWMETFKKAMGFTLVATAVWLADVFSGIVGPDAGGGYLWFMLFIAVGGFVFGTWGGVGETHARQALAALVGLAIASGGGWKFLDFDIPVAEACADTRVDDLDFSEEVPWQAFSEDAVAKTAGKTVFIDFTAKWCLTCKVTEKTVIETAAVRDAMDELGVVPLKADWTRYDPVITEWLARHGRAGVPFWLVLPADRSQPEIVLPDAMTQTMLIDAMRRGADGS